MKNKLNKLDYGAFLSLAMFIILNLLMWSNADQETVNSIFRSSIIAIALYVVPIILAHWGVKIAYHFLGCIMAVYTLSFILTMFVTVNHNLPIILRILIGIVALMGIGIDIVWYRWLFKHLKAQMKRHYTQNK